MLSRDQCCRKSSARRMKGSQVDSPEVFNQIASGAGPTSTGQSCPLQQRYWQNSLSTTFDRGTGTTVRILPSASESLVATPGLDAAMTACISSTRATLSAPTRVTHSPSRRPARAAGPWGRTRRALTHPSPCSKPIPKKLCCTSGGAARRSRTGSGSIIGAGIGPGRATPCHAKGTLACNGGNPLLRSGATTLLAIAIQHGHAVRIGTYPEVIRRGAA